MLGFILWGLFVNWEHGIVARIQVALTQGVISLLSTIFSVELITWMVKKCRHIKVGFAFAGGISWIIIYALIWLAHLIAGTPEIFYTMLPGIIIGVFFCFGYAFRIHRKGLAQAALAANEGHEKEKGE